MTKPLTLSRFYKLFVSALKGEQKDFTTGSIRKAIFMLSIPMIAEMLMESLFAVVDVYFVSQVSVHAIATVGLTESVLMIIYSIAVGLSMAVTAIIARRIGEKKFKRAADAAFQALIVAVILGLGLGIFGFVYAEEVLALMGGEPELIAEGRWYTKIMYAGNLSVILLFLLNAIFRGAGDASIAMRSLWIANILNMLLDAVLVLGWGPIPALGVMGAAIATTTGRSVGVAYQLYHLLKGSSLVKLGWQNVVVRVRTIKEIVRVGAAGVGQFLVESASWIFLVRVVSMFGSEALAGYTIAFRVIVFTLLPSWGMANAAATLVGQNLGARKPERAEASVWKIAWYNTAFLFLVSIVFFAFAQDIVTFFNDSPTVVAIGVQAMRIICTGYIFFAFGMVMGQAFNGAGDTLTPLLISIIVFWIIQIPMAYQMAVVMDWQSNGVFISIAICHSLYALLAAVLFKRGRWKRTVV